MVTRARLGTSLGDLVSNALDLATLLLGFPCSRRCSRWSTRDALEHRAYCSPDHREHHRRDLGDYLTKDDGLGFPSPAVIAVQVVVLVVLLGFRSRTRSAREGTRAWSEPAPLTERRQRTRQPIADAVPERPRPPLVRVDLRRSREVARERPPCAPRPLPTARRGCTPRSSGTSGSPCWSSRRPRRSRPRPRSSRRIDASYSKIATPAASRSAKKPCPAWRHQRHVAPAGRQPRPRLVAAAGRGAASATTSARSTSWIHTDVRRADDCAEHRGRLSWPRPGASRAPVRRAAVAVGRERAESRTARRPRAPSPSANTTAISHAGAPVTRTCESRHASIAAMRPRAVPLPTFILPVNAVARPTTRILR